MARSLNLYLRLPFRDLEKVVADYQQDFDQLLEDTFTDDELQFYEKKIEAIAALYVQTISPELSFDDFYPNPLQEKQQRDFFNEARSSICLENVPFLEDNPFQVSYLTDLIWSFDEVLIDRGGTFELMFRKDFLKELNGLRNLDSLIKDSPKKQAVTQSNLPVTAIDFLVQDIYQELNRLEGNKLDVDELPEKAQRIFNVMRVHKSNSSELFSLVGLNPKDFDDYLEKLKFWLRKQKVS